jgi:hypothetical protein
MEGTMANGSRISQLLWREAPALAVESDSPAVSESAGVPEALRKAVRFTLTGAAATLLTAQIVGIRLTAPVDASGSYATCTDMCEKQYWMDLAVCNNTPSGRYRPPSGGGSRNPNPDQRACIENAVNRRNRCKAACER